MSIHTTLSIDVVDQSAFNNHMRKLVPKWRNVLIKHQSPENEITSRAVDLAITEMLTDHPDCIRIIAAFNMQKLDCDKLLAEYRATNFAPDAFRSMFAEA